MYTVNIYTLYSMLKQFSVSVIFGTDQEFKIRGTSLITDPNLNLTLCFSGFEDVKISYILNFFGLIYYRRYYIYIRLDS